MLSFEDGVDVAKECECGLIERQRMESKLAFASIPETYSEVRLKDISTKPYGTQDTELMKEIGKSISQYLRNLELISVDGKGLYIWSHTKGSGKTMLASAIANELLARGKFVKFSTSMQILNEIKATWGKDNSLESKLLRDLSRTEYLVIDDFGTETVKDWMGDKFYQVINDRYINKKVTIFTSNYDIKELPYDERIRNRIIERNFDIHFPESSVREFIAKSRMIG